jgi:hypothetical protein
MELLQTINTYLLQFVDPHSQLPLQQEVLVLREQNEALQMELDHAKRNLLSYISSTHQLEGLLV